MHEHYMLMALEEARRAMAADEVPVGAVIVRDERVIAAAHNQRLMLHDPTAHAEMLAITQASSAVGDWRLEDCTLYVSARALPNVPGAILQARIPRLVYGADDPKAGAVRSLFQLLADPRLNHQVETTAGVLAEPCGEILTQFFQRQRSFGKK